MILPGAGVRKLHREVGIGGAVAVEGEELRRQQGGRGRIVGQFASGRQGGAVGRVLQPALLGEEQSEIEHQRGDPEHGEQRHRRQHQHLAALVAPQRPQQPQQPRT